MKRNNEILQAFATEQKAKPKKMTEREWNDEFFY